MRHSEHDLSRRGLAGLGVIALVCYRLGILGGGHLALDLLLALLGAALTRRLLRTDDRRPHELLRPLVAETVARLAPLVILTLLLATVDAFLWAPASADRALRGEALWGPLGVENWHAMLTGPLEGAPASAHTALQPFWGWGIAAQLAVVWAIAVVVIGRFAQSRNSARRITAGLALILLIAALTRLGLAAGSISPARLLYGTDLRSLSFLAGAFIAARIPSPPVLAGRRVAAVGAVALIIEVALWATVPTDAQTSLALALGISAVSCAALALLAEANQPRGLAFLQWSPLQAVGDAAPEVLLLFGPIVSIVRRAELPALGFVPLGAAATVAAALLVRSGLRRMQSWAKARSVGAVALPPLGVGALVLIFVSTGAFAWSRPVALGPDPEAPAPAAGPGLAARSPRFCQLEVDIAQSAARRGADRTQLAIATFARISELLPVAPVELIGPLTFLRAHEADLRARVAASPGQPPQDIFTPDETGAIVQYVVGVSRTCQ